MHHRMYMVLVVSILSVVLHAQTLVDPSIPLQSYNHKLALKLEKKRKLQLFAKITKEEAIHHAEHLCKEKVTSVYLDHQGQLLYYLLHTPGCIVKINALDGKTVSLKKKPKETDI